MLTVARVRPDQWEVLKTVRLAALQEAPYAFGTTYASASKRLDAEWQEMAQQRATSPNSCMYFVYHDGQPVGLAGANREPEQTEPVHLISVWVAPEHRQTGAGQAVLEAVCAWARALPVPYLFAYVTATNARALRFYERLGFQPVLTSGEEASDDHAGELLLSRSLVA